MGGVQQLSPKKYVPFKITIQFVIDQYCKITFKEKKERLL